MLAPDTLRDKINVRISIEHPFMADQNPKSQFPPYVSYKLFTRFINGLRDHLPARIDRSILGGMSGGAQSALISTLDFLGLVNGAGEPTKDLEELVTLSGGAYNSFLHNLLKAKYSFLDGLDLKRATASQVHEAFRNQGIAGSTVAKAMAFFLAAAKEAGLEVSKHVKPPTVVRSTTQKRNNSQRNSNRDEDEEEEEEEPAQGGHSFTSDVHPALAGVLMNLPPPGQMWPDKERKRFMVAFEAVLGLVYPSEPSDLI
jgi:hypothetical protein